METEKTPVFLHEKSCTVTEVHGLCGRPSCAIVMEAARSCGTAGVGKIFIRRADNGITANPFSMMSVMTLVAYQGIELVVYTSDPSMMEKVDSLAKFIDTVHLHTIVELSQDKFTEVLRATYA